VRRPTLQELLDAFVVRTELEVMAVRLAFPHLTVADVGHLAQLIEQMEQGAHDKDLHAETIADVSFHGRIIELTGNRVLQRAWQTTEPFSRTYITMLVPDNDPLQIAHLHPPIVEALRTGDVEQVVAAVRGHFERAADIIRRAWASEGEDAKPATVLPRRRERRGDD
jgi:DNA-binding GntR family transcriptional regulator